MEKFNLTLEDIYGITEYENKCKKINWYDRYFSYLYSFSDMYRHIDYILEDIKVMEYYEIKESILRAERESNGKHKLGKRY